jgi:hypothetical protein
MIHEIDEALEALIKREVLEGSGAEVVFDAPTKDWASRRNTPTIDVYLYDIREDTRRRTTGVIAERDAGGVLIARGEPPRYFKLSYLITAWTQRPEDEHRLLSGVLALFLRHKVLPYEDFGEMLAKTGLPVLLEVAKPPPDNRQISEVWTALGGELKAALEVMVTAPISSEPVPVSAPPASGGVGVRTFGEPGQESEAGAARAPAVAEEPAPT